MPLKEIFSDYNRHIGSGTSRIQWTKPLRSVLWPSTELKERRPVWVKCHCHILDRFNEFSLTHISSTSIIMTQFHGATSFSVTFIWRQRVRLVKEQRKRWRKQRAHSFCPLAVKGVIMRITVAFVCCFIYRQTLHIDVLSSSGERTA